MEAHPIHGTPRPPTLCRYAKPSPHFFLYAIGAKESMCLSWTFHLLCAHTTLYYLI